MIWVICCLGWTVWPMGLFYKGNWIWVKYQTIVFNLFDLLNQGLIVTLRWSKSIKQILSDFSPINTTQTFVPDYRTLLSMVLYDIRVAWCQNIVMSSFWLYWSALEGRIKGPQGWTTADHCLLFIVMHFHEMMWFIFRCLFFVILFWSFSLW
jgi:hypothetical protein